MIVSTSDNPVAVTRQGVDQSPALSACGTSLFCAQSRVIRVIRTLKPAAIYGMAACVLLQMLLAMAMAASPELHERFHPDAGGEHHECAVTHMLHGDFGDGAPVPLISVGPSAPIHETEIIATATALWVAPLFLMNGVLKHAPPALG